MESFDNKSIGGYDAYFINELLDEHECPVCKMALRKPIQTQCGHRLCLSCSEEMRKRNNGVLSCPLDKSILSPGETFPDKAIERDILLLKVKCSHFSNGCEWTGELKMVNKHLHSCEYQEVKCLNKPCSTSLLRKKLKEHMELLCNYRLVTCQHCKQKVLLSEKQIHEENCECLPLCCVNQCGMKIMRKEMSSHITDSCANTIIPCQYLNIGCKFKEMRKKHETHANSSMQNHLSMAISKLDVLENKITLTMDTLENKILSKLNALENKITSKVESFVTEFASKAAHENEIASEVNALENKVTLTVDALENKIMSIAESLETKIVSKAVALEKKITSKVKSFENKNASEVVAFKNKITSTVDAQKDKIMLHEKNLEIIKAFLAVKTQEFVDFETPFHTCDWLPSPVDCDDSCSLLHEIILKISTQTQSLDPNSPSKLKIKPNLKREKFLQEFPSCIQNLTLHKIHVHRGQLFSFMIEMQKKFIN